MSSCPKQYISTMTNVYTYVQKEWAASGKRSWVNADRLLFIFSLFVQAIQLCQSFFTHWLVL